MAEYIKRDDALRQVLLVETRENMFQRIKDLPAADVVKVIRCKNCYNHTKSGLCMALSRYGTITTPDYAFCSLGEKKDD